ncbi:C4-type zinc ribbon domain-containing protein [Leucobacter rhizosphaerae]|uniref:C4-type zinc ribbon domain-containing protein n=1 Tax=Leucobacter rhizosphaerae TaxID=2932245 RepID=A0ABY4FX55_9MICO|nr:C4-type zinc ribbon domain-containing protein [Leucobacter rhizosphaerae]UOQ60881.1 C4-type zinc ribbon domain-containing protein [Leucobacter rhizosphaerae]
MKASTRQQRLLLDLQDLDNTLARLRRKRATLPERGDLDALSGDTAAARDRFMQAQRELDTRRTELARIEADVATVQQRRDRDTQMLSVSTSSKEAQSLQGELDTLSRRQSELEDRELELMEVVEGVQATFSEAESHLAGIDARRAEIQARLDDAERRLDAELASNTEERAGLAAELQRDLLDLYEELRGRIGLGAARLRGNVSEGSNMALAPAELSDIRATAPDEIVFCPGSGAILVRDFED